MSTKAERGTKRTCQNTECGSRFYDLNRDPVTCPVCGTVYELAVSGASIAAAAPAVAEKAAPRKATVKKPVYPVEGDEEPAAGDEDETFLEEEEEDGSDMTGIIGGGVAEPDEPQ